VIVCHCQVVTDRAVRAAVMCGAHDVDAVISACGAGGRCGGCVAGIEQLLADAELAVRDPHQMSALQAARRGPAPAFGLDRASA
jgi:bacterioferritin-associated ferredoxin